MAINDNLPNVPKFELGIRHLFYVLSFYAAGLAITPGTIGFTTIWIGFCYLAFVQPTRRRGFSVLGFFVLLGLFGFCCLVPSVRYVREAAHTTTCRNNMRQMILAMHNYDSANGCFPKACMLDANGKPAHSWRVLILPFMEENTLFAMYDFDEPWDGPKNRKLLKLMPESFHCPTHRHDGKTHYKLVRGPGTFFEDGIEPSFVQLADSSSNTIALVEDPGNPVEWTKPDDLTLEEAVELFSNMKDSDIAHHSESLFTYTKIGSHVAMLDGSVRRLGINVDPEVLRKAFGSNNGDVGIERLFSTGRKRLKYGAAISAVIYVILTVLPVIRLALREDPPPLDKQDALSVDGAGVQWVDDPDYLQTD